MNNYNLNSNAVFITTLFGEEETLELQSLNIPGVNISYSKNPSRREVLNPVVVFEGLEFNTLTLTFLADETLSNWARFMTLMLKNKDADFFNTHHDGVISIRTNNGHPAITIKYMNIVITSISDLDYSSADSNTEITFNIDIQYDYFEIVDTISARDIEGVDDKKYLRDEIDEATKDRVV